MVSCYFEYATPKIQKFEYQEQCLLMFSKLCTYIVTFHIFLTWDSTNLFCLAASVFLCVNISSWFVSQLPARTDSGMGVEPKPPALPTLQQRGEPK